MALPYDAVLLIAFGGPTSPQEVRPFINRVVRGIPVPQERIEEVVRHYMDVGGKSPLVEITLRQARTLEKALREKGLSLRVYAGMRQSAPFLREALEQMGRDGGRRALGFILSSFQTEASWERYQKDVAAARGEIGPDAPQIDYCPGWHAHPLFIQATAERIEPLLEKATDRTATPLVFTAHSVPVAMAARSPYVEQIQQSSKLVAERLGHKRWLIAYQSRSGGPREPWLEPDIRKVIEDLAAEGTQELVVAPIGFVCDHVEVLYDLDIDARGVAEGLGMRFFRAGALNDHPTFIQMMAQVIEESLKGASGQTKEKL